MTLLGKSDKDTSTQELATPKSLLIRISSNAIIKTKKKVPYADSPVVDIVNVERLCVYQ